METDEPGDRSVVSTILSRRSIREGFEKRSVSRNDLETILACGLAAPSSKNAQPWRFHVLLDDAVRSHIADAAEMSPDADDYVPHDPRSGRPDAAWSSTVAESAAVLRSVPVAIAIENRGVFSGGLQVMRRVSHENLVASLTAFGLENMGLGTALGNMWLAANSLGISAAFLGDLAIAEEVAGPLLGCSGDLIGILALGYSSAVAPPRRQPPRSTQVAEPVVWH